MDKILYMTAGSEYWGVARNANYQVVTSTPYSVETAGQEGLARSLYESCDSASCSEEQLYIFLSGYQPWTGHRSRVDGDHSKRADDLIASLNNNHGGSGHDLMEQMSQITNKGYAERKAWTLGRMQGRPYQWFTTSSPPQENPAAFLYVDIGNGQFFYMYFGEFPGN